MDALMRRYLKKFGEQEETLNRFDVHLAIHKMEKLAPVITQLQAVSDEVFKKDISVFVNERIVYRLWKSSLYRFVAAGREILHEYPDDKPKVGKCIDFLISKSMAYFKNILDRIEKAYKITEDKFTGQAIFEHHDGTTTNPYPDFARDCYAFVQTLMGDTTRYSYSETGLVRKSLVLYDRARAVAPGKGRSYRQMGTVLCKQLDWLGAAYYLTRAKLAKHPEDVREELVDVYDEAYREYRKVRGNYWYSKAKINEPFRPVQGRKETWILIAGHGKIPNVLEDPHNKDTHFQKMTNREMLNRFMLSYVHFIGKLYTRIDVDYIDIVAEDTLIYFEGLIKRWKGAPFPTLRIIQIMALNMYIVTLTKEKTKVIPTSAYLETTVMNLVMEMFSVMCEELASIISTFGWKRPLFEGLSVGILLWLGWIRTHKEDWRKLRPRAVFSVRHVLATKFNHKLQREDDAFVQLAKLLTQLEPIIIHPSSTIFPSLSEELTENHKVSITPLPECFNLVGFTEFQRAKILSKQYFTKDAGRVREAQIYTRLQNIYALAMSISKRWEVFEISDGVNNCKVYKSLRHTARVEDDNQVGGVDETSYQFYTGENNKPKTSVSSEAKQPREPRSSTWRGDCNNARIIVRKPQAAKKIGTSAGAGAKSPMKNTKSTEAKANRGGQRDAKSGQIDTQGEVSLPMTSCMKKFEDWLYHSNRCYEMEILVEPKKLVIDTNCFVRHMNWIAALLAIHVYQLYIPVSVILELKGLCRPGLPDKIKTRFAGADRAEKFDMLREKIAQNFEVAEQARSALAYIQEHLDYFRIVTSTGRVLRVRNVQDRLKDDYFDRNLSNDERIVDTCRYLDGNDVKARELDCLRRIYRKTVVVTSDRNLRLKARSYDFPATAIAPFVLWFNAVIIPMPELDRFARQERQAYRKNMKEFVDFKRKQREANKLAKAVERGTMDQLTVDKILFKRMFGS